MCHLFTEQINLDDGETHFKLRETPKFFSLVLA